MTRWIGAHLVKVYAATAVLTVLVVALVSSVVR